MDDRETFLPIHRDPQVVGTTVSDRDTATAGLIAGASWRMWVLALSAMCSAPVIVIAVWRALL